MYSGAVKNFNRGRNFVSERIGEFFSARDFFWFGPSGSLQPEQEVDGTRCAPPGGVQCL